MDYTKLDEHITALREGNTLTENEVKALCEKVRVSIHEQRDRPKQDKMAAAGAAADDPRSPPCQLLL
jgi:hypothetical protein